MELLHNSRSFQGFAKLSGWDLGQVGSNRGKLWNLTMNTQEIHIQVSNFSVFRRKLLDLWVFGMGLKVHWNASRSVQRHTDASIWAARMLWLKHPLTAVVKTMSWSDWRCKTLFDVIADGSWNVECGTNLWQVRTNRGHPVCLLSSGMQLF